MGGDNIQESLTAVTKALKHFNDSLIRSGFEAGAASYQKMAEIVIAQWLWSQEHELEDHDVRFREIARLAVEIHGKLLPYVEAMRKLAALDELVPSPTADPEIDPDSLAGRILSVLREATRPQSITALRKHLGGSTAQLRREIEVMVAQRLVRERRAGSRRLYESAEARS